MKSLIPKLLLGGGDLNLCTDVVCEIHGRNQSVSGHNTLELSANLVVIDNVRVELIQPCQLLIKGFGNFRCSFEIVNFLFELHFDIIISKYLKNIIGITNIFECFLNRGLDACSLVTPL